MWASSAARGFCQEHGSVLDQPLQKKIAWPATFTRSGCTASSKDLPDSDPTQRIYRESTCDSDPTHNKPENPRRRPRLCSRTRRTSSTMPSFDSHLVRQMRGRQQARRLWQRTREWRGTTRLRATWPRCSRRRARAATTYRSMSSPRSGRCCDWVGSTSVRSSTYRQFARVEPDCSESPRERVSCSRV